jgi:hypothetical protein
VTATKRGGGGAVGVWLNLLLTTFALRRLRKHFYRSSLMMSF